jgi:hypothetical protein
MMARDKRYEIRVKSKTRFLATSFLSLISYSLTLIRKEAVWVSQ